MENLGGQSVALLNKYTSLNDGYMYLLLYNLLSSHSKTF